MSADVMYVLLMASRGRRTDTLTSDSIRWCVLVSNPKYIYQLKHIIFKIQNFFFFSCWSQTPITCFCVNKQVYVLLCHTKATN